MKTNPDLTTASRDELIAYLKTFQFYAAVNFVGCNTELHLRKWAKEIAFEEKLRGAIL